MRSTTTTPMLPSFRAVANLFALGSAQIALFSSSSPSLVSAGTPVSCPNPGLSCQSSSSPFGDAADSCCLNSPGGQLLVTQFWDTKPSTGPSDSWTIHGLWPDNCDGSYESYCDRRREYSNITDILESYGAGDTLDYMETYWKDYRGDDESFWAHEWDKHGTCINTLEPGCYTGYTPQEEVVDYFNITVSLFKALPTYETLANAGIVPSTSRTYTSRQIQDAISAVMGNEVTIKCRDGRFNEVWYHFNVQGSVQTGSFIPTSPDGIKSTCPASGIRYLPKGGS